MLHFIQKLGRFKKNIYYFFRIYDEKNWVLLYYILLYYSILFLRRHWYFEISVDERNYTFILNTKYVSLTMISHIGHSCLLPQHSFKLSPNSSQLCFRPLEKSISDFNHIIFNCPSLIPSRQFLFHSLVILLLTIIFSFTLGIH